MSEPETCLLTVSFSVLLVSLTLPENTIKLKCCAAVQFSNLSWDVSTAMERVTVSPEHHYPLVLCFIVNCKTVNLIQTFKRN